MHPPNSYKIGRRIAVVGCSGSGKTTLAKALAHRHALPYINADALYWLPNWTERPRPEYRAKLNHALADDAWTFDGNLSDDTAKHLLARIDTLIWLDYPLRTIMPQLLKRTLRRAWTQEKLFAGNTESWRMSFASRDSILLWAWHTHPQRKHQYEALWDTLPPTLHPIRLRSRTQAGEFLINATQSTPFQANAEN